MGKNLDSDRKFFCVTYFHVVRAVRCADSIFSRLDEDFEQSGQIQNAQNPARTIKKDPFEENSFLCSPEFTADTIYAQRFVT